MRSKNSRVVARPGFWSLAMLAAWGACSNEALNETGSSSAKDPDGGTQVGGGSGASSGAGGAGGGTISISSAGSSAGAGGFSATQASGGGPGPKSSGAGGAGGAGGTVPQTTAASAGGSQDAGGAGGTRPATGGLGGNGGSAGSGGGGTDAGVASSSPDAGSSAPLRDAGSSCPVQKAGPFAVRFARSAGYQGTLDAYSALYRVTCSSLDPCVTSCVAAGGTKDSCTEGSECISGPDPHCLPPTFWRYEKSALAADGESAEQTLVKIAYQDPLILRDFGVQVPSDASIRGIQFDVLRSSLTANEAVDYAVRVLRDGQPVGEDKKLKDVPWPTTLAYATYGGPSDTWGVTWTPADLASAQFGLSFAAFYTDTAGNTRAYVDFARVWIHYAPATCP